MAWSDKIFDFFNSKALLVSHKLAIVGSVIIFIIILDNYLGVSYNYSIDKKLTQLEQCNKLISESPDKVGKTIAFKLRKEISARQSVFGCIGDYFNKIELKRAEKIFENPEAKDITLINLSFQLSSSAVYYLLAILSPFIIFIANDKIKFVEGFISSVLLIIMSTSFGFLVYLICSLIPVFSDIRYNYLFNVLIQLISIFLVIKFAPKSPSET